jgi:hypothetical protein
MLLSRNNRSLAHIAALQQVKNWTRERFNLPPDALVFVSEIACSVPGCPPIETVVAFWTQGDKRHQFKLFKPVADVVANDLPPGWLKNALIADEAIGYECC